MTADPTPTPERPEQDEAVRLLREALGYLDGSMPTTMASTVLPLARNRVRDALVLLLATPPPVPAVPPEEGDEQRRCWQILGPEPISQCALYNGHDGDHWFGGER